jgi:hypothetical protein
LQWDFASPTKGIRTINVDGVGVPPYPNHPPSPAAAASKRMVSWTKIGPFWYVLNPIAVVYEYINQSIPTKDHHHNNNHTLLGYYTSCAYATQKGHWIAGEERVTVVYRNNNHHASASAPTDNQDDSSSSSVEVEIVSISQPAPSFMGRLSWPLIGKLQHNFFVQQLVAFHQASFAATTTETNAT